MKKNHRSTLKDPNDPTLVCQDDLHLQKLDYGFAHANAGDRKDQTRRPNTIPKDMKKVGP